jgi:tetraacyldisaccharide 4'-kinase
LYDKGVLKSVQYGIPVICVGNITVGGTGKTPHTEYIIRLLKKEHKVAVLSRGYRRKSKGLHFASRKSTLDEIGDEPLQIYRRFPDITLVVDKNRSRGIETILKKRPNTDVIIMDDGFQHRSVTPGLSIVLCDYGRPVNEDHLLPYGNLRETWKNIGRADLIVITKIPSDFSLNSDNSFYKRLGEYYSGNVVYTSLDYKEFVPVFSRSSYDMAPVLTKNGEDTGVILITGIANPKPLIDHLGTIFKEVIHLEFPDHHRFNANNVKSISDAFDKLNTIRKFIITTEKDAVRLREFSEITRPIQPFVYYLRMEIDFLEGNKEIFDKTIFDYVGKNQKNS